MSQCTCIFREIFPAGDMDSRETSCSHAQKQYVTTVQKPAPEERKFPLIRFHQTQGFGTDPCQRHAPLFALAIILAGADSVGRTS